MRATGRGISIMKLETCPGVVTDMVLIQTGLLQGIEGVVVTLDVRLAPGAPAVAFDGEPQGETTERIKGAFEATGFQWRGTTRIEVSLHQEPLYEQLFPYDKRVTINLAPADVRKAVSSRTCLLPV